MGIIACADWHTVIISYTFADWHTATISYICVDWHTAIISCICGDWHTAIISYTSRLFSEFPQYWSLPAR